MPDVRLSNGTCSSYYYFAFNYFIAISYIVIVLMLCFALALLVRARQIFHPIFSALLMLLLIGYVLCNSSYVITIFLKLYKASSIIRRCFDAAYEGTYTYIGCIGKPLFTQAYMNFHDSGSSVFDWVLFSLSILVVMLLVLLFFMNRKLVLSFRGGRRSLSTRYQLVENIRALRLFVPIIVLDTTVSILDATSSEFFGVESMFEARKCRRKYYIEANLFFRPISIIAEALIPIMAMRHEALYKKIPKLFCIRSARIDSGGEQELNTIRNVFGMDIQGQTDDYVEQLRRQWS